MNFEDQKIDNESLEKISGGAGETSSETTEAQPEAQDLTRKYPNFSTGVIPPSEEVMRKIDELLRKSPKYKN